MNHNTRDIFADGLDILKRSVLSLLYQQHKKEPPFLTITDIYSLLGIKRLKPKQQTVPDQLVHGILLRLRHEKYAEYIGPNGKWQITDAGVSHMNNDSGNTNVAMGLERLEKSVLLVLHRAGSVLNISEIHEQLGIRQLTLKEDDAKYDNLIWGILVRLEYEAYTKCVQSGAKRGEWQITDAGVSRIMETQAEDKVPSQQIGIDEVLKKINEIAKASATGDYIYRGEPAYYEEAPYNGRVTSGLYRQYLENNIEAEHFDVAVVQAEILKAAHGYTLHKMKNFDLLATLQHFGDKTNLIDFTTDYLVALFFACDGKPKEPGRVILLPRHPEGDRETYAVKEPPRTIRRAETQKSIFVEVPKGFVEPDRIVDIPIHLKAALLDYLRNHHDISTKTIYNDLQGFIENRGLHENAYTEFYKGITSYERGDYDKAIEHYTEAIDLTPENVEAYNARGIAYDKKGELDAAIMDYNIAIVIAPERAYIYINRGIAYTQKGELDAAMADYNTAIEMKPESVEAYNGRGLAYDKKSEFAAAIQDFNKAIALDPELVEPYLNRGNAYDKKGELDAAMADYNTAIEMKPEHPGSYYNRGIAYAAKSEFAAAIQDFNKAIALDPEDAKVHRARELAMLSMKELEKSQKEKKNEHNSDN